MLRSPSFWQHRGWQAIALLPLAVLYQLGYRLRRAITCPTKNAPRLLCIGNLVAGGAGKTPVALAIGDYIRQHPVRACFLSKGYGGNLSAPTLIDPLRHTAAEAGDEALLLAQCLPTIVAKSRRAGAAFAKANGFELAIMDDGFQNPQLRPDIALIVIDAAYGFGNGLTLPAGPLREPVEYGLRRADAIIMTHRQQGGQWSDTSLTLPAALPVLHAHIHTRIPPSATASPQRWLAFAGIARPQAFFDALAQQCGAELVACRSFADHHPYSPDELYQLQQDAQQNQAQLLTTAKDAVRLPDSFRQHVMVAEAAINWHNDDKLHALLAPLMTGRTHD